MTILFFFATAFFILLHFQMVQSAKLTPTKKVNYVIILGARLHGDAPSLSLLYRLEKAVIYLKQFPDTKVVVSGGQGPDEWITEAEAMAKYLIDHGIDKTRIIKEEKSTTTYENLKFSKMLIPSKEVVIITNDFHIYRTRFLAKQVGLDAQTAAALTPKIVRPKLWMREYLAVIKSYITKK